MATKGETVYNRVPSSEDEQEFSPQVYSPPAQRRRSLIKNACFGGIVLVVTFVLGYLAGWNLPMRPSEPKPCENPIVRREWRTLSTQEKNNYISAVQCLQNTPSRYGQNQSAFDDFPWIHSGVRGTIHETAQFLAWHRYFIHIFEGVLQDICGFQGHLPYWDWVLDWEDFRASPVWDDATGFGGNGSGEESMGEGTCVSTGPFANYDVKQFGDLEQPHCLSRGFLSGDALWNKSSSKLQPSVVDNVLDAPTYDEFNIRLELGPHLAIPHGVNGDFIKTTAPYDPVFYLHHAQLDRLWWLWQQRERSTRLYDYGGGVRGDVESNVGGLDDILQFQGLGPDIKVHEVMDSQSGSLFCYKY